MPARNWGCAEEPPARIFLLRPADLAAVAPSQGWHVRPASSRQLPILFGESLQPLLFFPADKKGNRSQFPPRRPFPRSNQWPFETPTSLPPGALVSSSHSD